jgi:hypothetical protein
MSDDKKYQPIPEALPSNSPGPTRDGFEKAMVLFGKII